MKIKEEQLTTIKEQQEKINSILHQLGYFHQVMHDTTLFTSISRPYC